MAFKIIIETRIRVIEDGQAGGPPLVYRNSLGGLTKFSPMTYSIATATTQNVWDPLAVDNEIMSDFDRLIIISDQTVQVGVWTDDGGEVGKNTCSHAVIKGIPFMLGADDSYANPGADNPFSGTLDLTERIAIRNDSGSTATVTVLMAT